MKKQLLYFIFAIPLIFVFFIFSADLAAAQTFVTNEGNEIEVKLKPDKETIMLGETTFISFIIENHSKHDLSTGVGGDYRNNIGRPDSFTVTVVRDDGLAVPQPQITFWGGGFMGSAKVPANGSSVRKLFLPHWATFLEPGTYTIEVSKYLGISSSTSTVNSGFTAKVSTKIRLVPTDNVKLGVEIDSLGKTMLDESNWKSHVAGDEEGFDARDALMILDFINDQRVIKYLVQGLDTYVKRSSVNWEIEYTFSGVASALSKYNDDSAFEALKRAAGSENKDVRLDVADALGQSKHPQAINLILNMRSDGYYMVRLRALWAWGKVDSDESTAQLKEMLKDENEYVRQQAQEFLNKRTLRKNSLN